MLTYNQQSLFDDHQKLKLFN